MEPEWSGTVPLGEKLLTNHVYPLHPEMSYGAEVASKT